MISKTRWNPKNRKSQIAKEKTNNSKTYEGKYKNGGLQKLMIFKKPEYLIGERLFKKYPKTEEYTNTTHEKGQKKVTNWNWSNTIN